jgi:hypothetical protein
VSIEAAEINEPEEPRVPLPSRTWAGLGTWLIAALFVIAAGGMLFLRSMSRDLNHDEHQFLAPPTLLLGEGLLPYRDYPLFHLPNLIFAYAAMGNFTDDVIDGGKILSVLASTGVVGLLFWVALARSGNTLRPRERLWVATGAAILLLFDPLFLYTSGKTWNHELPAFLLALAVVLHVESFHSRPLLLAALSGFSAGLATGTRLTYGPPCAAFLVHLAIWGGDTWRDRLRLVIVWGSACFVALLPSFYFLVAHREAFLFDNFTFPRLAALDPDNERAQKTMKLANKVRFLVKEVASRSWPLIGLYLALGVVPILQACKHRRLGGGAFFSVLLALAVVAGCFAPSRYQYQHFYAVSVVCALGIVYRCKEGILTYWERRIVMVGMGVVAVIAVVGYLSPDRASGWRAYLSARAMRDPAVWFTNKYRTQNAVLQRYIPVEGRVLTLAPAAVLAANRKIYPEFATGPFAWRGAKYVLPALRSRYRFVGPDDLEEMLRIRPPAGILTGVEEEELEGPLVAYAEAHSFTKVELPKRRVLWLPPEERVLR